MEVEEKILTGHSDLEKGAYLGAIASIATADRVASPEEMDHISALCSAANLSEQQTQSVIRSASGVSGEELERYLDVLKNSELKYSLVADLIAFAKSDEDYSEAEQQNVHKIAGYLGVSEKQYSLLDQFTAKAAELPADQVKKPEFLSGSGLNEKLQQSGINTGSLLKGLISIAGPMILGRILSRGIGGGRSSAGLGGSSGGLGSLIGMLSGGRGFGGAGGLLGRMFGGRM